MADQQAAAAASVAAEEAVVVDGPAYGALLLAIRYSRGSLELLDQRKLPLTTEWLTINDAGDGWKAIHDMVVRGAPAIAIAGVLSLAVELVNRPEAFETAAAASKYIHERMDYLVTSRPTAVNLAEAAARLKAAVVAEKNSNAEAVVDTFLAEAEGMLQADVAANLAIGKHGAAAMLAATAAAGRGKDGRLQVLTHCNTGSLATSQYGTALGVVRALHAEGQLQHAYCTETRPYNQGSRLTAYELVHDNIPATLIADSAASALMAAGKVDAVVVGADRIASNGDTANKIGTYQLAVAAATHKVPFFIAAPVTTIDLDMPSGASIIVEERKPEELTHTLGGYGDRVAAEGIGVWNPAFDVTPAEYITGIITDIGVARHKTHKFDLKAFVNGSDAEHTAQDMAKTSGDLQGTDAVMLFLRTHPPLAQRLGGSPTSWKIKEVGDGNINFVYIVEGPDGSLVLKQALGYVRCVGETWPLSPVRVYFEAACLTAHRQHCPEHTPEMFLFDAVHSIIAMRYIKPPHEILRKGFVRGVQYPKLPNQIATYMANTLYHTSLLAINTTKHRAAIAQFSGNVELCRLTEQVIFTDPYYAAKYNQHTSPQLDEDALSLRSDTALKAQVVTLKAKFCEQSQALLHGDLHTGSIMATQDSMFVIDPEFTFVGPMGFDIGLFLGNLLLAYFAQDGYESSQGDRQAMKAWLLDALIETWQSFSKQFLALWTSSQARGDLYPKDFFATDKDGSLLQACQTKFMRQLLQNSIGFGACEMIRRLVGIAHVEELEAIQDADKRAICERRALQFARNLVVHHSSVSSIEEIASAAKSGSVYTPS
eukprot:jgi/Chlat1/2284/Chrsp17S02590